MCAEMQTHMVTGGMRTHLKRKLCERISKASTHNILETIRFEREHRACDVTGLLAAKKVNAKMDHTKTHKLNHIWMIWLLQTSTIVCFPLLVNLWTTNRADNRQLRGPPLSKDSLWTPKPAVGAFRSDRAPHDTSQLPHPHGTCPHNTHPQHTRGRLKRCSAILFSQWSDPIWQTAQRILSPRFKIRTSQTERWRTYLQSNMNTLRFISDKVRNIKRKQCRKTCTFVTRRLLTTYLTTEIHKLHAMFQNVMYSFSKLNNDAIPRKNIK